MLAGAGAGWCCGWCLGWCWPGRCLGWWCPDWPLWLAVVRCTGFKRQSLLSSLHRHSWGTTSPLAAYWFSWLACSVLAGASRCINLLDSGRLSLSRVVPPRRLNKGSVYRGVTVGRVVGLPVCPDGPGSNPSKAHCRTTPHKLLSEKLLPKVPVDYFLRSATDFVLQHKPNPNPPVSTRPKLNPQVDPRPDPPVRYVAVLAVRAVVGTWPRARMGGWVNYLGRVVVGHRAGAWSRVVVL